MMDDLVTVKPYSTAGEYTAEMSTTVFSTALSQ